MKQINTVVVVIVVMFALGMGILLGASLQPKAALAASATATAPAHGTSAAGLPRLVAVTPAADGAGWYVQLDTGTQLAIEPRVFETGGTAPTPGPVRAFADQRCLFGVCTGYAVFTDGAGRVYHGYRP